MFVSARRMRQFLLLAAALPCSVLPAKEKKDPSVDATIKLYEENKGKKKSEHKLTISCKTDSGRIVSPATFTYTVEPADACEVSPASGTESKTGKQEFTFKYKKPGECKITFKCGDTDKKVVLKVVSIEKPKAVFTGPDEEDDEKPKQDKHSEKTLRMVETQDALVASFFEALAQPDLRGAGDPYLAEFMTLLAGVELMPPVEPADLEKALAELESRMGSPSLALGMFPATGLLLDLYDTASTRHFQSIDCNANGRPDFMDLADGLSSDANGDLVPDDCNCRTIIFDADDDRDVDQSDFGFFQACMTGPKVPADVFNAMTLLCRCMDVAGATGVDPDGAVDGVDLEYFIQCRTGPASGTPLPDPRCDGW